MEKIVKLLTDKNKTIATMESCTGGGVANQITNIEGASQVLKFSAVTYCNEYKIKMGVSRDIIDKYSVYSIETARSMSFNISKFADASYGVGITGKLNREDKKNPYKDNNKVYVSIYDKEFDKYYDIFIEVTKSSREDNKQMVINKIKEKLESILCEK